MLVGKKILITGGSGFIGRNLINSLKEKGAEVINLSFSRKVEGIKNILIDLTKPDFSELSNLDLDYVIHLAAFSSPARSSDYEKTLDLNYNSTQKLLNFFSGKNIKKFIFFSSSAVYADSDSELFEDYSLRQDSDNYSKSKILAEQACIKAISSGAPLILFRLSNCYGPYQQWKKEEKPTLIPQLIAQALSNKKIEVFTGKPVRDFIYVSDVCDAIISALNSDYNGVLNLGSGAGNSVREVAEKISSLTNSEISFLEKEVNGPKKIVLNISRAKFYLNWEPKVSLSEGLFKTIEHYRNFISNMPKKADKIKLMKSTFYREEETKKKLSDFIITSSKLSMGQKCREFESEFSKIQGRKKSVLFNSGSSANLALFQAMINLKILKKGDKVGFSSVTWPTNISPIIQMGLIPVPIDINTKNLNICSNNLLDVLNYTDLRALFVTNVLGFSGDIHKIEEICRERGIILLEDNCESLGSELNGRKLGNFGLASTFSFFVGHHLSTVEGGMVCTDDPDLYEMLLMVRAHGWSRDNSEHIKEKLKNEHKISDFFDQYSFYQLGYNLRPTEITGFLGLEQLQYYNEIISKREINFKKFQEAASQNSRIVNLDVSHMSKVSNFAFPLLFENQRDFETYRSVFANFAEIRPIISGSMTEQPFFKKYIADNSHSHIDCVNAKKVHSQGFYFANNPELTEEEVNLLCSLLSDKDGIVYKSQHKSSNMKKALITGITGQDGSYLAELLLEKGYEVHGLVRRSSTMNRERLHNIYRSLTDRNKNFLLHYGDMTDSSSLIRILSIVQPDEIYNLAAQSHVQTSFEIPEYTALSDALGVLKLLEAIRLLGLKTKFYQASTSELFGKVQEIPQKETTPFYPRSPYGVAKLYAYWIIKNYREAYNMFACNGILFNHESERRGENFVSRKITLGVASIKHGLSDKIFLGNLDAKRDWGYAPDYVEAMWRMLQTETPEDLVIATGETHSVREFVELAFKEIGINIIWQGSGVDEKGIDASTGKILVEIDPRYFRPTEVDVLLGDYSKAKEKLGWEPKVRFHELVKIMVKSDIERMKK